MTVQLPNVPDRVGRYSWGVPFLVLAAISVCLPFLLDLRNVSHLMLASVNIVLVLFGLVLGCRSGYRPMVSLFFAFQFCWLTLPSLYQISAGKAAWGDNAEIQDDSLVSQALIINGLGLAAFLIGYNSYLRRSWSSRLGEIHILEKSRAMRSRGLRSPGQLLSVAALLAAMALTMLPLVATTAGGIEMMLASRSELSRSLDAVGVTSEVSGGGVMVALVQIVPGALATTAALATLLAIKAGWMRNRSTPAGSAALLIFSLSLLFLYANPMANTRFTFLATFGAVALAMLVPRGLTVAVVMTGLAFVSLLVLYPLANFFRGVAGYSAEELSLDQLATLDFDGFQQILNSIIFVDDLGNSGGTYTTSALLFFVPRSIWTDKAIPASIDVASHRGYNFTNVSLPIQSEVYIEFGWLGIIVVFLLVGALWSRLDDSWLRIEYARPLVAVAAAAQIGLIRGPMGAQVPIVGLTIILAAGLVMFSKGHPEKREYPVALLSRSSTADQDSGKKR